MQHTGHSSPIGATVVAGGVNVSLFSRDATGVEVLLLDREDDARPARVMRLDPVANRTYHSWMIDGFAMQETTILDADGVPQPHGGLTAHQRCECGRMP